MKGRRTFFDYGRQYHNGKLVGWATWKVHRNCHCEKCPTTVAHFYGRKARTYAKEFASRLNKESLE